jgi:hypothetical protein
MFSIRLFKGNWLKNEEIILYESLTTPLDFNKRDGYEEIM